MPEHFSELPLSPVMQRALAQVGWSKPSPIQARVIPHALEGYDILGQARTGTGKTASFAIPILEQLDPIRIHPLPQALVLVPTRELAHQVYGEFVKLAEGKLLTEDLIAQIKSALRQKASPRHVPSLIVQAPEFPRTKSNKLVELAVANAVNKVTNNNLGALANPESLAWFSDLNL